MTTSAEPHSSRDRSAFDRVFEDLRREPRLASRVVVRSHPLVILVKKDAATVVVVPASVWDEGRHLLKPFASKLADGSATLVLIGEPRDPDLGGAIERGLAAMVPSRARPSELYVAIASAFELLEAKSRAESRGKWLSRYRYELGELVEIAKAISTEREIDKLLGLILEKSRFITGADAGSFYVVEGDDPDPLRRTLRFKLTQNDSVAFDWREFSVPVSSRSMSGYVALHKSALNIADVYDLPPKSPFGFDPSFDAKIGYRTKSMLCAPLLSRSGDVIGVIQLINKKREVERRITSPEDAADLVVPFDERSEELLMTLASQAGIALENAILYAEINRMLEGFVRASVEAIEQRDPTTSGHSRRVADLTVGLARSVEREDRGPYRGVRFTKDDLRELEYASLLHDFGKIGVREEVLVKAKKLYDHQLENIRTRFDFSIRSLEADTLRRKIHLLEKTPHTDCGPACKALDEDLDVRVSELRAAFEAVVAANEPRVLSGGDFARIEAIARETYTNLAGETLPLITPAEVKSLSVPRGSLTPGEIDEIRSHVVHTFEFLSQIPWGKQFRRVALIAGAHHERLNGTGYPNRLQAEEIPLQSKMMSIADIFDALTASDRPYKRAVPLDRALDILSLEVKDQHIDGDLLGIFVDARVWECLPEGAPRSRVMP
ncbi:MAG TPA: HD domain-containing phosphohydrolase [Polyangiaceae bacterium]|jgi:HD-GYP domain-containing protein (c-di-GMP phosphodiesterase class II)|nr:HD domain-containing phosphohydrolase [Polyangiaceae bacterium]